MILAANAHLHLAIMIVDSAMTVKVTIVKTQKGKNLVANAHQYPAPTIAISVTAVDGTAIKILT